MSRTKRNNHPTDEHRTTHPYRRKRLREMLQEFEQEYREQNQSPVIEL